MFINWFYFTFPIQQHLIYFFLSSFFTLPARQPVGSQAARPPLHPPHSSPAFPVRISSSRHAAFQGRPCWPGQCAGRQVGSCRRRCWAAAAPAELWRVSKVYEGWDGLGFGAQGATQRGCTSALKPELCSAVPLPLQLHPCVIAGEGQPPHHSSSGTPPPVAPHHFGSSASLPPCCAAATVEGLGENASTLVHKEAYRFLVDEPPKLGGKGMGEQATLGCCRCTRGVHRHTWRLQRVPSSMLYAPTFLFPHLLSACRPQPPDLLPGLPGGLHPGTDAWREWAGGRVLVSIVMWLCCCNQLHSMGVSLLLLAASCPLPSLTCTSPTLPTRPSTRCEALHPPCGPQPTPPCPRCSAVHHPHVRARAAPAAHRPHRVAGGGRVRPERGQGRAGGHGQVCAQAAVGAGLGGHEHSAAWWGVLGWWCKG